MEKLDHAFIFQDFILRINISSLYSIFVLSHVSLLWQRKNFSFILHCFLLIHLDNCKRRKRN